MAYATTSGLAARLGADLYARLTDRAAGRVANAAVAQQTLDEAEALLNSYLARRYATPIDAAGDAVLARALEGRTLDLAEFLAWRGSPFVGDVPERVRILHDEALGWLRRAADGQLDLPAAIRPAASTTAGRVADAAGTPRTLTHEELRGL